MGGHRGKPVWGKPRGPGVPAPLHTGRAAPRRPRTPRKGGGRRGTQWGRAHGLGPGQGAGRRPGARLPRLRPNKAARGAQPRAAARRGAGSFPPPIHTPSGPQGAIMGGWGSARPWPELRRGAGTGGLGRCPLPACRAARPSARTHECRAAGSLPAPQAGRAPRGLSVLARSLPEPGLIWSRWRQGVGAAQPPLRGCQYPAHSLTRSLARPLAHSLSRPLVRSLARSLTRAHARRRANQGSSPNSRPARRAQRSSATASPTPPPLIPGRKSCASSSCLSVL